MNDKIDIKALTYAGLEEYMAAAGQPGYRAGQVFKWLSLGVGIQGMTNLPKELRSRFEAQWDMKPARIIRRQESQKDGTVKYLIELFDGNCIETVLMKYKHGWSICLSTQAGCKMGCVFCASYDPAKSRNLGAGEILDQIILAQKDRGIEVSNIVLMGTGEPLDNYDSVMDFLDIVSDGRGMNIGMRHISLSTCGIVPRMDQLARRRLGLTLSVSLHAPNDEIRNKLMPINRKYDIITLVAACRRYFDITGRRISFEYALIGSVNDSPACARELAALLKGMNCHVNLIPLNRVEGSPLAPPGRQAVTDFTDILLKSHINATVRRSLGGDIDASCGQLRRTAAPDR